MVCRLSKNHSGQVIR